MKAKDLVGRKYGLLVVLKHLVTKGHGRYWLCKCACGNTTKVLQYNLGNGHTKSCGCLWNKAMMKHGDNKRGLRQSEYYTWASIRQRCCNPNNPAYKWYGKRGIKMCQSWKKSYTNFIKDMGYKPSSEYSIDRIDVNGDYKPGNVRWATWDVQCRNKQRSLEK